MMFSDRSIMTFAILEMVRTGLHEVAFEPRRVDGLGRLEQWRARGERGR